MYCTIAFCFSDREEVCCWVFWQPSEIRNLDWFKNFQDAGKLWLTCFSEIV